MIFFLIFNVSASNLQSFLDFSQEDKDFLYTSAGSLAAGVHNVDISIISLSSQLNSSLKSLGLKIDSSLITSASAIKALLDSEISNKHMMLSTINSEIHYLLRTTEGLYNDCSGFRTCNACSYNPLCV